MIKKVKNPSKHQSNSRLTYSDNKKPYTCKCTGRKTLNCDCSR